MAMFYGGLVFSVLDQSEEQTVRRLSFFYLSIAIIILFSVTSSQAAEKSRNVFIVASYEQNHICGGPQEDGAINGLNKEGWFEGMNLTVKRYYMDTKKKNTTRELMRQEAKKALSEIDAFKPEVVILLDDNAFREVGLPLVGRKDLSVVFSGMNGQPENYNQKKHFMESRTQPGGNVTGVYEKLYVVRSMKVMAAAIPAMNGRKVIGITDYSPTGNAISKQFELEMVSKPANIDWQLVRVNDWQEYKDLIGKINNDDQVAAIYPVALSLKVSDGVTYSAPEIFKWTMKHSKKPEMALNYFFSKIGLFGGAAVDFKEMGFVAGRYAGEILNGAKVGDLPIVDAPDYAIVFNQGRAAALGIDIPAPLLTAADHVYQ